MPSTRRSMRRVQPGRILTASFSRGDPDRRLAMQIAQVARPIAVVVGEGAPGDHRGALLLQAAAEGLGSGRGRPACRRACPRARWRARCAPGLPRAAATDRSQPPGAGGARRSGRVGWRGARAARGRARAGVRPRRPRRAPGPGPPASLAQRTPGQHASVSEPELPVEGHDVDVPGQPMVLEAVVEHEHLGAECGDRAQSRRPRDRVPPAPGRRVRGPPAPAPRPPFPARPR